MANSMEGQETVHSVCGPLTHSVAGKILVDMTALHFFWLICTRHAAVYDFRPGPRTLEIRS